ncbi:MAG: hypothetical protein RL448_440 [Actinomycetota bacterium]|jgi:5-formyltetrahydrofolate cyclo-ligase
MAQSKSEIRNQVRENRRLNPVNSNFDYLLEVPEVKQSEVIASFYPIEFEPNPISLNEELIKLNKVLLLPRINDGNLEFIKYDGNKLMKNGIFHEPEGIPFFGEINTVLVPALSVDRAGIRLGQGGGFYDKFLATTSAFRIALINENEFVKALPHEWHDQKMDAVALATGLVRIPQ